MKKLYESATGFRNLYYITTQDKELLDAIGSVVTQMVNQNSELPDIDYVVRSW